MPKDPNEIGALWIKNEGTQKAYLSGTINGEPVVVFKNKFKKPDEKTPDYRVLKAQQRQERPAPPQPASGPDDDGDSIPF